MLGVEVLRYHHSIASKAQIILKVPNPSPIVQRLLDHSEAMGVGELI
jgi:hypothetical protein